MARIRTIKPDFFRHELMQDLEITYPGKYPMMVFAGLWGHCDKAGRFLWRPKILKLDILPFLPFDMFETLELLAQAGLIKKYTVDGVDYGLIPTFTDHQRISGKESLEPDRFPAPTEGKRGKRRGSDGEATGKQRGSDGEASGKQRGLQEGKGREGNKEGNGYVAANATYPEAFELFWKAYPKRAGNNPKDKAFSAFKARVAEGHSTEEIIDSVSRYAAYCQQTGKVGSEFVLQAKTFVGTGKPFAQPWDMPTASAPDYSQVIAGLKD